MSTTIYLLEPEATPPPPRRVNTGLRARLLLISGAALFAVIIFGGLTALVEASKIAWLGIAGRSVGAHVISVVPIPAAQPGTTYTMTYAFDHPIAGSDAPTSTIRFGVPAVIPSPMGGRPRPAPRIRLWQPGDKLAFRYVMLAGRPYVQLWDRPPYGDILLLVALGSTLAAVGWIFMARLIGWHRRRVRLLGHGLAVTGSLVLKRVDSLEGKFYLKYSFRARADAAVHEHEEQCTPAQWRRFNEGEPVTVLYDPSSGESVGLYRLLSEP